MKTISTGNLSITTHKTFKFHSVGDASIANDFGCKFERIGKLFIFEFKGKVKSRRTFRKRCKDLAWR